MPEMLERKRKKERKDKLNNTIRNKIAAEITLNPKKSHSEIGEFYGISRQLVSLIAKEFNIQRDKPKGLNGSFTYPIRKKADIEKINMKYSFFEDDFFRVIKTLS